MRWSKIIGKVLLGLLPLLFVGWRITGDSRGHSETSKPAVSLKVNGSGNTSLVGDLNRVVR
jgi:hypothetical protein